MATTDSQSHLIKNGSRAVSSPTTLDRSATTTRTESYARNDEVNIKICNNMSTFTIGEPIWRITPIGISSYSAL